MLLELEKYGWERDVFADVIFDGDEIFFSYSHPSFPRCSLIVNIRIHYSQYVGGISMVACLQYDGDAAAEWYDVEIDIDEITKRAEQFQLGGDDDEFNSTC
jgi:hypothetical protein